MKLVVQLIASSVFGLLFFGFALFLPAWTLDYWQTWVFIGTFLLGTLPLSIYLAVKHPDALRRRMNAGPTAETRPVQRIIISATVLLVIAISVMSAFDHRFGWSTVAVPVVVLGDVLVWVGLTMAQLVVVQNAYASANITVEADQTLVSTGLYGIVRHPMYLGALIMMAGTPLALDSYWGLVVVFPALLALGARIVDEETMLTEQLAGYDRYVEQVHYRLVPGVW